MEDISTKLLFCYLDITKFYESPSLTLLMMIQGEQRGTGAGTGASKLRKRRRLACRRDRVRE